MIKEMIIYGIFIIFIFYIIILKKEKNKLKKDKKFLNERLMEENFRSIKDNNSTQLLKKIIDRDISSFNIISNYPVPFFYLKNNFYYMTTNKIIKNKFICCQFKGKDLMENLIFIKLDNKLYGIKTEEILKVNIDYFFSMLDALYFENRKYKKG